MTLVGKFFNRNILMTALASLYSNSVKMIQNGQIVGPIASVGNATITGDQTVTGGLTYGGIQVASGTAQTLTGAGAVDITTAITWLVTTGTDALTLADGAEGQEKFIIMKTDGGTGTLTPSNLGNGTTLTFDDAGDSAHLIFTNGNWYFMGGTATLA